jgi:signal transduction histidine kinase/ligand-binding sensor domain-containing protein
VRIDIFARGTVLACAMAWSTSAFALNPDLDVSQYAHTSWKIRDGFSKGAITSIAQTTDGYLWLGTELGLLRFDGVRPVAWQPPPGQQLPSSNIRNLLATRDGSLWIASDEGLARWKDGQLTRIGRLAGRYVDRLVEDHEGSLWATTFFNLRWTLCVIRHDSAECFGDDGGPGVGAIGLYEDRKGNLWVGTVGKSTGVWRWRPSSPTFYALPAPPNGIRGLVEDDDGVLLVSQNGSIARFHDGKTEMAYPYPQSKKQFDFPLLLRDRNGGLWLGSTSGGGLVHVYKGRTDVFASSDGLSGDGITTLFEDREGNIWVSTVEGLDRFRDLPIATYSTKQGFTNGIALSVLAATDGSIWLGTAGGVNRWTRGRTTIYQEPGPGGVQSIFEDSLRRVWISTLHEVGFLEHGRFVAVTAIGRGPIRSIVEDRDANVWIANEDLGLFRVSTRTGDVDRTSWADLKQAVAATAMTADRLRRGVWLGFPQSGLVHFIDGQVQAFYGTDDGLGEGRVRSLRFDRDGAVWAATEGGLSRLKDGRVTTLTVKNGLPCDQVHWNIEDNDGAMWVALRCGLVRITRPELDAWKAAVQKDKSASTLVHVTVLDSADGFRMVPGPNYFSPSVAKSSDGRLWFPSEGGLSVVDPRNLPSNSLRPPVHIEQIIADRKTFDVAARRQERLELPARIRDLQIDYTALSFVAPEQMRFRYKLEGHDSDWQDVGTRRQAFYNDLPPRRYRFRVMASNNSGVWNEAGAVVDFSIAPAYYQTTWFLVLSASTVLALVWSAHRVRLRIVETHEREISFLNERLMKAQEQERIRIAGELHDGVMQQMLAVTMMLGTAKRRTSDSDTKTSLDKIQDKLIQAGTDIRQLSHDLHPPILQEAGLPEALRSHCEEFSASSGIPVACDADDAARDLSRGAALALFRIAQEALANAAKHAHAKRITVRLTRSADVVSLSVSDDGAGFDAGRLGTSGGLGLVMMRERASQLNGTFQFESAPGRGTTISVEIPFR